MGKISRVAVIEMDDCDMDELMEDYWYQNAKVDNIDEYINFKTMQKKKLNTAVARSGLIINTGTAMMSIGKNNSVILVADVM